MARKSNTTVLTSAAVRALFQNGTLDATKVTDAKGNAVPTASLFGKDGTSTKVRGRVHPAFYQAAEAAGHGVFAEKVKVEKTITISPIKTDVKGRKRTLKAREVPVSKVRALAGASAKGRLSAAHIAKAAEALGSE